MPPGVDVIYSALGLGVFALVWFWFGMRRLRRLRPLSGTLHCVGAALAVAGSAALFMTALNLYSYERLTHETPVARLTVEESAPQTYTVTLAQERHTPQVYTVHGDEWQLDVRFIKWKSWAVLLGKDPLYRFERLSGRYRAIAQEQGAKRSVYVLSEPVGIDLWSLARDYGRWLPWVDAYYGNAAYMPLVDGADYAVALSHSGLVVRPADPVTWQALDQWK